MDMKYATQSMECIMTSRKYGVKSKGRAKEERAKSRGSEQRTETKERRAVSKEHGAESGEQ